MEPIPSPFTIKRAYGRGFRANLLQPCALFGLVQDKKGSLCPHAARPIRELCYFRLARSWKLVLRLHSLAIITIEIPPISKTQFHLSPKIRLPMKTSK